MLYGSYGFITYFVAYPLETEIAINQKLDVTDHQQATGFMDHSHNGMCVMIAFHIIICTYACSQTIIIKSTITCTAMYLIIYTIKGGLQWTGLYCT